MKTGIYSAALVALTIAGSAASAEEAIPGRALITAPVDDAQRVVTEGNIRPEAIAKNDRGALPESFKLDHMYLQLRRSPAQEQAVDRAVDELTRHGSPTFHQWLTAEQFGERYGVAQADIDRISAWLRSEGLTVNQVYPGRMVIDFSGTAGAVKHAFRTEIHRLDVDGKPHIANMSNPQIPAALAPAIEGVVSLHDFRATNKIKRRPRDTGSCDGSTCWSLAPGDLQTIYDFKPLYEAGYTGEGEVIAAVEGTNLYSNSDFTNFRSIFQLTKYAGGKLVVQHPAPAKGKACADPGVVSGDDGEATLDVEWATAAAPGATILLASCDSTDTSDGVFIAAQNLVNSSSPPPVISVSYGICEAENGSALNASFNKLYQQASAEGISVFVATGDNGPTDCASSTNGTTYGIGVNGWGATKYNVAVGGTDFGDTYAGTNSTYWGKSTGAPWSTAKSYIPEIAWNDTCASTLIAEFNGATVTYGAHGFCNSSAGAGYLSLGGGEGGPSGCYSGAASINGVVSGTCKPYPKPSWQTGVAGIPADGVRDVPDVAMFASDGSVWSHALDTCFTDPNGGSPCTGNPASWAANAGGTSYATPIMAAVQVLVDQYAGGPQGNPAPTYYALAAADYGTKGNPSCSASLGNKNKNTCTFHDIVQGDDDVDCKGTHNCYRPSGSYGVLSTSNTAYKPAYKATTGYDFPTGLGSVDVSNLAANWPTN